MDPVLQTVPSRTAADLPQPHHPHLKPLWAAIGVLGVVVAALGGTLVYEHVQEPSAAPSTPVATLSAPVGQLPAAASPPPAAATQGATEDKTPLAPAPAAPPVVRAPPAAMAANDLPPSSVPTYTPSGVIPPGTYGTSPAAAAAGAVCADCGRIESVSVVHRAAPTTGVGAVAGGVLGAVLGNQFGHGGGRAATTLLGAGGGAYLGNSIEQRNHARTVYLVHVRMDNGTRRTFERAEPVTVGQRVTVEGHGFRLGLGETYSTAPAPQSTPEPGVYSTVRN